jgi:lipoprotein-releasing system permease protein
MLQPGFTWFVAWRHLREARSRWPRVLLVGGALIFLAAALAGAVFFLSRKGGEFPSFFPRPKHVRWADGLQIAAQVAAALGCVCVFLGLLFRVFTVFTSFSISGVLLGTFAPIIALSVMSGFETDLKGKIRGSKADITISAANDITFTDWKAVLQKLDGVPGLVGATPFVEGEVMMKSGSSPAGVILRGIDPATAGKVFDLEGRLKRGRISDLRRKTLPAAEPEGEARSLPGIILGQELFASTLRVFVDDPVDVYCPLCGVGPTGPTPDMRTFRVAGHFYSGMYDFDSKLAYAAIDEVQRFLQMTDEVSGIDVRTTTPEDATRVAAMISARIGKRHDVRTWEQLNSALFSALRLEKIVMFLVLTFIGLVASFSIVSNLYMMVTEKAREVAILKSMGATAEDIRKIFVTEGLYIGLSGSVLGVLLGVGGCLALARFGPPLPSDIYYIEQLPVVMRTSEIVAVALIALSLSCLAAVYPAMLAARLHPVEGLRYE